MTDDELDAHAEAVAQLLIGRGVDPLHGIEVLSQCIAMIAHFARLTLADQDQHLTMDTTPHGHA